MAKTILVVTILRRDRGIPQELSYKAKYTYETKVNKCHRKPLDTGLNVLLRVC